MHEPDKVVEAHFFRTNDWMDTCAVSECLKVQHFCLTLVEEARLWCKSLRPKNVGGMGHKISIDNNTLK